MTYNEIERAIHGAIQARDSDALIRLTEQGESAEKNYGEGNRWPFVRGAAWRTIAALGKDKWLDKIEAGIAAVEQADGEYAADLDSDGAKKAYDLAKKAYRAIERAAFADGFYWTCGRCAHVDENGRGSGRWVNGGTCFNCGGSGFHHAQTPHKFAAAPPVRAKRDAAHAEKIAAEALRFAEALAALPEGVAQALRDAIAKHEEFGGYYGQNEGEDMTKEECFRYDLAMKLKRYGSLTGPQIAAVQRGLDRAQARQDEAERMQSVEPLAEGRYVIEGEVVSTKTVESDYSAFGTLKMLVKMDDGNKVWGTVPASIECDPKGERVMFTGTVERSRDDEHFGFFKRPTGATLVGSTTKEEDHAA
jgi:hypothetical protein